MFEVEQEVTFVAEHELRAGGRPDEKLHPHRWRVVAAVRADELDAVGFVVDFVAFGRELREIVAPFDNRALNHVAPFTDWNPTAELIAVHVARELDRRVCDARVRVHRVRVFKDSDCATYYPPRRSGSGGASG